MKNFIQKLTLLLAILWAGPSFSQTYSRISLTNFVLNGGVYTATTNINVPANTLAAVISDFRTANAGIRLDEQYEIHGSSIAVQYDGGPWAIPSGREAGSLVTVPVLGPCVLKLTATSTNNISPAAYAVLEFRTGNFSRVTLTNFVLEGGIYTAKTNINIPVNTRATVISDFRTPNAGIRLDDQYRIRGSSIAVQYDGGPWAIPSGSEAGSLVTVPVLGPCVLKLTATSTNNIRPAAYAILELSK